MNTNFNNLKSTPLVRNNNIAGNNNANNYNNANNANNANNYINNSNNNGNNINNGSNYINNRGNASNNGNIGNNYVNTNNGATSNNPQTIRGNPQIENFPSIIEIPSQKRFKLKNHLNYKKQNIVSIFIIILTLLAAFGFHAVFMFIIKTYVKTKRIGVNMEFFTRLSYPVLIFLLIWLSISGFV